MKIIQWISDLEITFGGGLAVYAIMCILYVTFAGITITLGWMIKRLLL